ncbi:SPOSA6832_01716, partial [Sporobolomyces salmonicolor]
MAASRSGRADRPAARLGSTCCLLAFLLIAAGVQPSYSLLQSPSSECLPKLPSASTCLGRASALKRLVMLSARCSLSSRNSMHRASSKTGSIRLRETSLASFLVPYPLWVTPIAKVLKTTLPRIYLMSGLVPPSAASPSSSSTTFSPSLIEPVVASIPSMPARPGLGACAALLQMHNFRVMAATNGGLETTRGLFENALGKEEAGKWEYFSCDEDRVAKPSPSVYEDVWKRLGLGGVERKGWFVASHTWRVVADLFAAKKAGFKTAFVTYEEHLVLPELFGQPDIVATDLEDAARQIIAAEAA